MRCLLMLSLLTLGTHVSADTLDKVLVQDHQPSPQTGDVVLSETTGASSLITSETLNRPGTSLSQVLAREAGTQVRRSGGLGSYSSATLRGSSSDQVLIYLDGLLINDAAGNGFNLSNIELMQADAIEIYRGSTPVQLSNASLGGAINIRTHSLQGKSSLKGTLGIGSFNTRQVGLFANSSSGKVDILMSLSARQSDNDFPFLNDNATAFNSADDFNDHRKNSEVEQSSVLLKLGRALNPDVRQDISLQYFDKNQHIPNFKNSAFNQALLDTKTLRLQMNQTIDSIKKSAWNSKSGINVSKGREEYSDRQSQIGLGRQHDLWRTETLGLNSYWEYVSDSRTFSLSADIRQENFHVDDLLNVLADSSAKRNILTLAIQESLFFKNNQLLFTPALRYQKFNDDFKIITASITENSVNGKFSNDNLSPQLGAKYQLSPQLGIHSNIGRYRRVPSFFELFGDRGLFIGNDELKPESGINFDIGFNWKPTIAGTFLNNTSAQVSVFYNDVNDAISRVYNARGIGKSVNIKGALILGVEWDIRTHLLKNTQLQFKGTLQDAENRDTIPAFLGKQLPGQAQQSLSIYLDHQINDLQLYYEFIGKANRFYDTANLLPAADQSVHTVGLKLRKKRHEISLELNNIGNDVYEDFNGFPKPGRALFMTYSYLGTENQ